MLGVGLDWAESFHDVALGVPGKGMIEQLRFDHGPAGIQRLISRCLELEPDSAEVRVVVETRHGLLAEALSDAGFTVLPINPDLVAAAARPRRRMMPKTHGSAACSPWMPTWSCANSSPTARTAPNCGPLPVTMSAPPATNGAWATGCAPTCSRSSAPRSTSPTAT